MLWTDAQGLPDRRVQALIQTRDGYLWIGTAQGLARFDGQRFTVFDEVNTPGLASDNCTALAEDSEGALWVGTTQGLAVRRHGRFTGYGRKDGLGEDEVRLLEPARRGGIWVAGLAGIQRWHAGGVERWSTPEGLSHDRVYCLKEGPDGVLWVGTQQGLQTLSEGTGGFGAELGGAERTLMYGVHGVLPEAAGAVWVYWSLGATQELRRLESGAWTTNRLERTVDLVGRPAGIVRDRRGRLWISAGRHGLDCFENGRFLRFTAEDGLAADWVLSLIEDRAGNLWIGTEAGLSCWRPIRVETITARQGLVNTNCWAVLEAGDGAMWVGTDGGLTKVAPKGTTSLQVGSGPRGDFIRALLEDREGRLWVGTGGGGLDVFVEGGVVHHNLPGGLSGNKVRALVQTPDRSIWVGTEGGVHRQVGAGWRSYGLGDGLLHADVRALNEDGAGGLWAGTYGGGVARWVEGRWESFTTRDGLASDFVWGFCSGTNGVLWAAGRSGLSWRMGGKWFKATVPDGLLEHAVNSVIEDGIGHLWFGGNRGVYRLRLADLLAFGEGREGRLAPAVYGQPDGMPEAETNGQKSQPAVWRSRDGRLWFPTVAGVSIFDPARLLTEAVAPVVQIEEVRTATDAGLDRGPPTDQARLRLPPGAGRLIEFHYTACAFTHPEVVRFRYRLEGLDADWVQAGARRAAYYTHLDPGSYTFVVEACAAQGVWSGSSARLRVELAAHLYETRGFQGAVALGFGGLLWIVYRRRARLRQRMTELERANAVGVERERIARDLHDEVGATLTAVATRLELVSRGAEPGRAEQVRHAQALLQGAARTMSDIIWSTDPRQDTLEATVAYLSQYAADFLEAGGLQYDLVLPAEVPRQPLPAALRHDLLLVVKEALTNIVRHARAARVRMSWAFAPGELALCLEDDGGGLAAEPGNRNGNGIANMRRRVETHRGTFEMDVRDGQGTRVRFHLPLSRGGGVAVAVRVPHGGTTDP